MRALVGFVAACFVGMIGLILFGLFKPEPAAPTFGTQIACTFTEFCVDGFCDPEGPAVVIDTLGTGAGPILALGSRPETLAQVRTGADTQYLNIDETGTTIRIIVTPENRFRFQEYWPEDPDTLVAEGEGQCAPVPL